MLTDADKMAATLPLREALIESISSGRFEDTKVILYSRRDSSGTICRPRALYASSHVLKTVPYFNDSKSLLHFPHGSRSEITSFEAFVGLSQKPGQKISQSPLMIPRPVRIIVIALTAISRKTAPRIS